MKRFILFGVFTLMLAVTVALSAEAQPNANTSTCPVDSTHCTGSGGGAGR